MAHATFVGSMPITVGTRITRGHEVYLVGSLLKGGGFGEAFLAEQTEPPPAKVVVIKVPRDEVLQDPVWSLKFAREARILANIRHRNVVGIIAFLEFPDGDRAMVQELVTNAQELSDYVRSNPAKTPCLILQALYALRQLQERSNPAIVHRDISPANILIDGDGVLKVIDFGLAKEDPRATQVLTVTGQWFGTPGCMSPEQMTDSASVDHRTDHYGLGRSFAAAIQHRNPQHADPSSLPEPFRTLFVRMTQHDRDHRHASATDAMNEAMLLFAQHSAVFEDFDLHLDEHRDNVAFDGWAVLCEHYFSSLPVIAVEHVRQAWKVSVETYALPVFNSNGFFDALQGSQALADYNGGTLPFEAADYLGELYAKLYLGLDAPRREACFRQICKTAIQYHRYSVMHDVRHTYAKETDPALQQALAQILIQEDPDGIIHGRGILPRDP
jgi:hypothetical protein